MWSKDLINEQIALLQEIRDKIGELVDRRNSPNESVIPSANRGRNGPAGQSQSDLSNLARSLEGVLGNLGRVVPGLSALASSIRAVRTSLEGIGTLQEAMRRFGNGPTPAGPGATATSATRSPGSPREDLTGNRRRWNDTILRAAEVAAARELGAGVRSRAEWVKTVLGAKPRQQTPVPEDIFLPGFRRRAPQQEAAKAAAARPVRPADIFRPNADLDAVFEAAKAAAARPVRPSIKPGKDLRENFDLDAVMGMKPRVVSPAASPVPPAPSYPMVLRGAGRLLPSLTGPSGNGPLPPGSNLPAVAGQAWPLIRGRNYMPSPTAAPWVRVVGVTTNAPRVPGTALVPAGGGTRLPAVPGGLGPAAGAASRIVGLSGLGAAALGVATAAAAAIAVGAAMVALPPKIAKFTDSVVEEQRKLSHVDGRMAGLFAGYDIRTIFRNRQLAKQTFATTEFLARASADLNDSLVPQKSFFRNLKNTFVSQYTGAAQGIADATGPIFQGLNKESFWTFAQRHLYGAARLNFGLASMLVTGRANDPAAMTKFLMDVANGVKPINVQLPWSSWIQQARDGFPQLRPPANP